MCASSETGKDLEAKQKAPGFSSATSIGFPMGAGRPKEAGLSGLRGGGALTFLMDAVSRVSPDTSRPRQRTLHCHPTQPGI